MSLFSRLFGKTPDPQPDAIRQQLFAVANDPAALERLCRQHHDLIRQHFATWQKLPDAIRGQPAQAEAYMVGLVALAQAFAQLLGDPSLLQALMGPPGENPFEQWDRQLGQARQLHEQLRYREASSLLADLLIDMRRFKGPGLDDYLPVVLGTLGESYFHAGEAARAVAPSEQALEVARRTDDGDGVRAYLGNLYECHRYLEQPEPAARRADELADVLEQAGDTDAARRYRRQARLVRAGEPRNRVVAEIDGRRYEMDEVLAGVEGRVRFYFERNKLTLRPAAALVERGERAGGQGRYDEALADFRSAAAADPFAPEPHHQAAVTLLHLGRAAEAVEGYERTEELAPGWFHCRSEGWLARQIALGRYPIEVFELLRVAEDGGLPTHPRRQRIRQALAVADDLAVFHHLDGKALAESDQPDAARHAYERGLDCAEEPDIQTRLLVSLATLSDPSPQRRRLLEEAVRVNGNHVAVATARLLLQFD